MPRYASAPGRGTSIFFGVRLAGVYVDPLEHLAPRGVEDLIRLVPIPA